MMKDEAAAAAAAHCEQYSASAGTVGKCKRVSTVTSPVCGRLLPALLVSSHKKSAIHARLMCNSSLSAPFIVVHQGLGQSMATPASAGQSSAQEEENDLSLDVDDEGLPSSRRARQRPLKRAILSDDSDGDFASTPLSTRRQRGRPRVQVIQPKPARISASVVPADALQDPPQIEDDENVLALVDEDGERKVDDNGRLFGDRKYRVRTFTLLGRGQRLYMLSTEPARCMGYRDSYLFFLRHKTLHRVILDENEKDDLADRELIPNGYRTRQLAVLTARSVFREFGARSVVGGRRIVDDYWEKEYLRRGFERGTLADPNDRLPPPGVEYNCNQFVAWHGASNVYHTQPQIERRSSRRAPAIDDVNWITAHAQAASAYNAELSEFRKRMLRGVHEAHTAQWVYPAISQPDSVVWHEIVDGSEDTRERRIVDTQMCIRIPQGAPCLLDIEESIFETAAHDIKVVIREQQRLARLDQEYFRNYARGLPNKSNELPIMH